MPALYRVDKMKTLAVIPARGGSVRIPGKNIKNLWGKPLIQYAIEAALNSGVVDRVIVSTDSPDIARVSEECGAEVPFLRPVRLSGDVPTEDVVIHAVSQLESLGFLYDNIICLEPPVPFRSYEHIKMAVEILANTDCKYDSVLTVTPITERPEWMLRVEDNIAVPYTEKFSKNEGPIFRFPSSMEFERLYRGIGIVIGCKRSVLDAYSSMVGRKCYPLILDKNLSVDLDWPQDWERCESLKNPHI